MGDTPAPGWYPDSDPQRAGTLRYWDGTAWTEHTAPAGGDTWGRDAHGAAPLPAYGASAAATSSPSAPPERPRRSFDGAGWARVLIGAVFAAAAGGLTWYLVMHRFALRGQWLGSGLAVAFGSAVGMLVGYWTSDRRQKNGWLVAGIAGTVALFTVIGATDTALAGTPLTRDDITLQASFAPMLAFMAAFTVALKGSPTVRHDSGWKGLMVFGLVPLLLAGLVYVRWPADEARSEAIRNGTIDVAPTTTISPEDARRIVRACETEKRRVNSAIEGANWNSGYLPGPNAPPKGRTVQNPEQFSPRSFPTLFYSWAQQGEMYVLVPIGSPPC